MEFQRTLKSKVTVRGVGLHSNQNVTMTLLPAPADHGIVFVRTDLKSRPVIEAKVSNVVNTQLATTLGCGSVFVSTVEHVLAALQGLQIDNAIIEVDRPEVPILDGSSTPFFDAIENVGTEAQLKRRSALALRRRVELKVDGKWAAAEPSDVFEVRASIEWDHPAIGYQSFHYREGTHSFREISSARTFGFVRDVERLQKNGLSLGASLENAVGLDDFRVVNPEGLRYPDEFVRHKVLDALGDLKLAGMPIRASFRLHRAGHDLHSQLLRAIFLNPANYEIVSLTGEEGGRATKAGTPAAAHGMSSMAARRRTAVAV